MTYWRCHSLWCNTTKWRKYVAWYTLAYGICFVLKIVQDEHAILWYLDFHHRQPSLQSFCLVFRDVSSKIKHLSNHLSSANSMYKFANVRPIASKSNLSLSELWAGINNSLWSIFDKNKNLLVMTCDRCFRFIGKDTFWQSKTFFDNSIVSNE